MKGFCRLFFIANIFFASCGKIQSLVYKKVDSVNLEKLFSNSTIQLNLLCYNPNRWGVILKKADCKVYVDSIYMGEFKFDSSLSIPAHKDFIIPANIKIDAALVFGKGLELLGKSNFWLKVVGSSTLKKAGIRFKIPIYYEGEQKIEI